MPILRWDIFCDVVDNYGDAAVCWRLARQLSSEHGQKVRLYINNIGVLRALLKDLPDGECVTHRGVTISAWPASAPDNAPHVVVEAFACTPPGAYRDALEPRALWINLEYLSMESWAEGCHTLPSPQGKSPQGKNLPPKYFFFPGFTDKTGGLLREQSLLQERDLFTSDHWAQDAFRTKLGLPPQQKGERIISLFAYENPLLPSLLNALAEDKTPTTLIIPHGRITSAVIEWSQHNTSANLHIHPIPFLSQDDYDRLLWFSHLNFVRGEDSFVRAGWAEAPFIWQAYPQKDDAHLDKVAGFCALYDKGLEPSLKPVLQGAMMGWNGSKAHNPDFGLILKNLPALARHNANWGRTLARMPDLSSNIIGFAANYYATTHVDKA